MAATAACRQLALEFPESNGDRPQSIQPKRSFRSECLVPAIKERIFRDWLRGVGMRSLGIIYQLKVAALEEILREQTRLAISMRRMAAATAMCLIGIFASHAVSAQPGEEIAWRAPRSSRGRRGRKRGLDDGYRPAEIRWEARRAA